MFIRSIGASLTAAVASFALAAPALAQSDVPSYSSPGETIKGTISSFDGKYGLSVRDERGFLDNVQLRDGTIINPTGLRLASGMSVTILGQNAGNAFVANEIDTPYHVDDDYAYSVPGYANAVYPGYDVGYGGFGGFGYGYGSYGFGYFPGYVGYGFGFGGPILSFGIGFNSYGYGYGHGWYGHDHDGRGAYGGDGRGIGYSGSYGNYVNRGGSSFGARTYSGAYPAGRRFPTASGGAYRGGYGGERSFTGAVRPVGGGVRSFGEGGGYRGGGASAGAFRGGGGGYRGGGGFHGGGGGHH